MSPRVPVIPSQKGTPQAFLCPCSLPADSPPGGGRKVSRLDYLPAFKPEPALAEESDRLRETDVLLDEDTFRKGFLIVPVKDRDATLENDRTGVHLFGDKMDRAPCDLDTVGERLTLRMEARETREERGVDIDNSSRELPDDPGSEDTHVTGKYKEVCPGLCHYRGKHLFILCP